jgi:hypothetical protein
LKYKFNSFDLKVGSMVSGVFKILYIPRVFGQFMVGKTVIKKVKGRK